MFSARSLPNNVSITRYPMSERFTAALQPLYDVIGPMLIFYLLVEKNV